MSIRSEFRTELPVPRPNPLRWQSMARRAQTAIAAAAALLCAAAGFLPQHFRAGRVLEWKLRDAHVLLTPPRAPENILIVSIDESATEAFPEPLLFWHNYYARAIERLAAAGARVTALDMVFAIPVESYAPGLDARLAAAIAQAEPAMPVLLGTAPLARQKEQERAVPANLLAASLGRLVDVALIPDEDDFIRRVELEPPGQPPALALAAAEILAGRRLPRPAGPMEIRHAGPAGTVARIPLNELLAADDQRLRSLAHEKIVLIGADLPFDRHATPYYAFRPGHPANTAGVEIHASAIATLLDGNWRSEAPAWVRLLAQFLAAFGAVLLAWRFRGRRLVIFLLLWTFASAAAGHAAARSGWWLSQTGLALGLAGGAIAGLIAARRLLREAVHAYAGAEVARAAAESGSLAPEARLVRATVLFTDARGFSSWGENRSPAEIAAGLSSYLGALAEIAARHGGTVNKLSGDGMLVLFLEDGGPGHAARAIAAAREMLAAPGELRTSAGIHTGELILGVVSAGGKLEYTALGDAVNIAARLEQLNRETGTQILISEAARAEAGLTARPVGCFLVKGRRAPVDACTLEER